MKSESERLSGCPKRKVEMKSESERMSVGQIREFDGGSRVAQVLPYPGTEVATLSCQSFSRGKTDETDRGHWSLGDAIVGHPSQSLTDILLKVASFAPSLEGAVF